MLKKHHRFFQSIQVLRDAALVGFSFSIAYWVRFSFPEALPYTSVSEFDESLAVGLMLTAAWPCVAWFGQLYVSRRNRNVFSEAFDVFKTTALTFLVVVSLTYFFREIRYSRMIMGMWLILTFVQISLARVFSRIIMRRVRARGNNLRHVLIVGTGELAARVSATIESESWLGLRIRGYICTREKGEVPLDLNYPILGTMDGLQQAVAENGVDQVIVALPVDQLSALPGIMRLMSLETVDVRMVPDFYQYMTLCGGVEELSGMPIINLQLSPLYGWNLVLKRAFDICFSLLALFLLSPIMALVALGIKVTSHGEVFFRQGRVGIDGRVFSMYKFRTMRVGAESNGAKMTVPGDDRCTRLGVLLRRTSLDELPQLWNVFLGEMSLVGPRPEQPQFIEEFKREIPRYALRHKMKAGMTGWAQINGLRGQTSIEKRIELDLYYIENWSIFLDFKILIRTVLGGFLSPNAY